MKLQPDTTHLSRWPSVYFNQYKRDNNSWLVYSPKTGWRKSANDNEWFAEETELGYFVERKHDEHG